MSISPKTIAWTLGIVAALYLGLAYALAPWAWRHYEHQRGLADRPMITTTRFGIPGDRLESPPAVTAKNVAFRGLARVWRGW